MATFQEIINGEHPVLVDFNADWCNPCKVMTPIIKDVKTQFGNKLKVLKINIDKNPAVADKFQVRGVPTFILFHEKEIAWRQSGIIEKKILIDKPDYVIILAWHLVKLIVKIFTSKHLI